MRGGPTFDAEKVSFNLAKMKKAGEEFEIVIDPNLAVSFKETGEGDIKEILKAEKVFCDAKKGLLASEEKMKEVFGTTDAIEIATKLLSEGEIQLTSEYRQKIRDDKRKQLIQKIHRNAIEPKTGMPHPVQRIELAFEEAKIKINELLSVDAQMQEIIKKLQPILPIRFEKITFKIHLNADYAHKLYGDIKQFGTVKKEDWLNDGGWLGYVEIPAGLQNELVDMINNKTHGGAEIEKVKE